VFSVAAWKSFYGDAQSIAMYCFYLLFLLIFDRYYPSHLEKLYLVVNPIKYHILYLIFFDIQVYVAFIIIFTMRYCEGRDYFRTFLYAISS